MNTVKNIPLIAAAAADTGDDLECHSRPGQ
jgi:hypothetical protein